MKDQLLQLEREALSEVSACADLKTLEEIRVQYLGRKGRVTDILRGLAALPAEEKPLVGQVANQVKEAVTTALDARKAALEQKRRRGPPKRRPATGHCRGGARKKATCTSSTR